MSRTLAAIALCPEHSFAGASRRHTISLASKKRTDTEVSRVILWWIGNILLIAVVAPVCLLFLNRVLRPTFEIRKYVDDVLDHGVKLTGTLDCVPNLIRSCELTGMARLNVTRYGLALARLLPQ